jgi:Na+/melibiose symporter-like transporter
MEVSKMAGRMQLGFLAGTIILFTPMPTLAAQEDVPVHTMFLALGGMLLSLAIVVIALHFSTKSQREKQKLIEQCIEKGRDVPPELLAQTIPLKKQTEYTRRRDIRRGIWLLYWGLGLVAYIASDDLKSAAFSLIFLFLGAGSFVNAMFFSGKPNSDRK